MPVLCRDGSDPKNPTRTGEIYVIPEMYAAWMFGNHRLYFVEESLAKKLNLQNLNMEGKKNLH